MTPVATRDRDYSFEAEFRAAGVVWTLYACAATGILLIMFLAVPHLSNRYSSGALAVRLAMLVAISGVAYILYFHQRFAVARYVAVVGTACFLMLGGIVLIIVVLAPEEATKSFSPLPVMMFALVLNYGFLRLPLAYAALLAWAFSLAIVVLAPESFSGSGQIRALLYVASMNVLGMLFNRSLESRERELFIQRRRAEAAQAALGERARAAEEAHMEKTRLLAAVSHDLRQPMMAAQAHLESMSLRLRRGDAAQAEQQATLLRQSLDMLGATLDHLLTAARYDSGTEPIRIESVELGPILRRLRETFAGEAAARGIELRIRVPDRRLVVTTDATALWRVLMNLVSNGIKFTQGDGRAGRGVLVKVRLLRGVCRVDVVDTGIGISEEHLGDIWQPYFQVANSERNRERGLGLGLFLVHRALDHLPQHSLELRSRPGRGSRFTLRLPGLWFNQPEIKPREQAALGEHDLNVLSGGYVLLLEDDRDARRALQEVLSDWGVLCSSGATLEELIADADDAARIADAVISDYRLPGTMTGIDCIAALRQRYEAEMPAVLITGESDLASVNRRLPSGTTLLQKPFDLAELARPLVDAMRNARRMEGA